MAPYPEARPAVGSAVKTRFPLEIDRAVVAIVERDHTAVLDLLIAAERSVRRSARSAAGNRPKTRLSTPHAGPGCCMPWTMVGRFPERAKAYQDGACTICLARPLPPGYYVRPLRRARRSLPIAAVCRITRHSLLLTHSWV